MVYSHAKVHGQRSVVSDDRVETDGKTDRQTDARTEAIALPAALMWSVRMRRTGEERRLTKAEKERIDGHAVDAEEQTCDDVGRDHDNLP